MRNAIAAAAGPARPRRRLGLVAHRHSRGGGDGASSGPGHAGCRHAAADGGAGAGPRRASRTDDEHGQAVFAALAVPYDHRTKAGAPIPALATEAA